MVVALRLAPEPSLNKPPTEAQYALEALQLQDPATLTHAQVHYTRIFLIKISNLKFISIVIGDSGTGSSNCQDKNEWGYCEDQFRYACTDNRFKDWFVPDCEKLCGRCSGDGEYYKDLIK